MSPVARRALLAAASLAALGPGAARAAEPNTVNVNYVYASTLGFGGYSLAGLTASVYTLPLAHTVPLQGTGGMALRVTLPVQLGLYSFRATDTDGSRISINQQSLAVVPGLELRIPVSDEIVLKPFVSGGAAHAFGVTSGADNAWIYAAGLRGVAQRRLGAYTLSLGAAGLYAGDSAIGHGFSESYAALAVGAELRRGLGFSVAGITPDAGIYAVAYDYPKPLVFSRFLHAPLQVRNQGEIGLTVGSAQPIGPSWLSATRIGAGYVFGDGLQVWHVVFGFPF